MLMYFFYQMSFSLCINYPCIYQWYFLYCGPNNYTPVVPSPGIMQLCFLHIARNYYVAATMCNFVIPESIALTYVNKIF